jgi:hypothetical protein
MCVHAQATIPRAFFFASLRAKNNSSDLLKINEIDRLSAFAIA